MCISIVELQRNYPLDCDSHNGSVLNEYAQKFMGFVNSNGFNRSITHVPDMYSDMNESALEHQRTVAMEDRYNQMIHEYDVYHGNWECNEKYKSWKGLWQ